MAPPHMRRAAALARGEPYKDKHAGNPGDITAKASKQWQVPAPNPAELRWLRGQGVSRAAILYPWPIGATNVTFNGKGFELDAHGERVLTFLVEDWGGAIDIAAFQPRTGKLATWLGAGFAIGQDAIFNPATYFADGALLVHETPVQWLLADRDGIVIAQPDLAHAYLANLQRVVCSDTAHARQVERWLQSPRPTVEILVEIPAEGAAA
jgi:hypothetical protein